MPVDTLTDSEVEKLARLTSWLKSGAYHPQPKQRLADDLAAQVGELLYGGAPGGGKSEFGLNHVVDECENHPNNRGLILRREWPSIRRSILPRLRKMLVPSGRAVYNETTHEFRFPNGSILELGSLQYESDTQTYQGAEYGVVFFEELGEFTAAQYEEIRIRLRAPAAGIRPHMIATANFWGVGYRWLRTRWIQPQMDAPKIPPLEIWTPPASKTEPNPASRVFVPATLDDNPALEARDPSYRPQLEALTDPRMRRAALYGDPDAMLETPGALWDWSMIVPNRKPAPPDLTRICVAWDPSGTKEGDENGFVIAAKEGDDYWILDDRSGHFETHQAANIAVSLYHEWEADALVIERYGGNWVQDSIRQIDPNVNVVPVDASHGKRIRARPTVVPYSQGRVHHVREFPELEAELTSWVEGDASPNRLDALVWALTWLGVPQIRVKDGGSIIDWALANA